MLTKMFSYIDIAVYVATYITIVFICIKAELILTPAAK